MLHLVQLVAGMALILATAASTRITQPSAARIALPYGISLTVPTEWSTSREDLGGFVTLRQDGVRDATRLPLRRDRHLILFGTVDDSGGEASIEISIMPTAVSQQAVRAMTPDDIRAAEHQFREEILGALSRSGYALVAWNGTTKAPIGGRMSLLSKYRYRTDGGSDMTMESYGVYLGQLSIQLRIQFSSNASPALLQELDVLRKGVTLSLDSL